jgi:thymidylate synthase
MSKSPEYQYLELLENILKNGILKPNRTGMPTKSIFGHTMRFPLWGDGQRILPALTTKQMPIANVIKELLWFTRGDTNANHLSEQGVKIWDANSTREFLDKRGLSDYQVGDIGPGYGFQWRHFNAKYQGCNGDYTNEGVDQLAGVIKSIREDPFSRRHIVSAWNPCQLSQMALPPCHMLFQFNVDPDSEGNPKYLSCMLTQRSADIPLGIPFNIVSYSMLVHMISYLVGLEPKEFVISTGDTHIYHDQILPCYAQLTRTPKPFPHIKIAPTPSKPIHGLDDFHMDHFTLTDYDPWPVIVFPFAV